MNSSNVTDARIECSRDSSCIMFYEERKGGSFQSSLSNSSFYNCTASTTIKQGCRQNDILYKKGNIDNLSGFKMTFTTLYDISIDN